MFHQWRVWGVLAWCMVMSAGAVRVEDDWLRQDVDGDRSKLDGSVVERVLEEVPGREDLRRKVAAMRAAEVPAGHERWEELYLAAAELRRGRRLATVLEQVPRIVFIKRRTIRPSFFGYTEGQSDAQHESVFLPGSSLCLLEFDGTQGKVRTLMEDDGGVFRDPAVSWDGERLVFAWKKSHREDDYHLYELQSSTGKLRQLTAEVGVADFEPAFLPNGDLVFSSSRCVQTVDCWWTEVSNLYTCGPNGENVRRLGFDQVHTVFPQVLDDGRVVYTRWDYNDRGQVYPQPLFQMNADGTGQTEFYGNNSWFPTTITHARGIPGTGKVIAILCGHHSAQAGKLAVIDPAVGRQEAEGVQLVSPVQETKAVKVDAYGQRGELFRYPYPLNESEWLVSYAPEGWGPGRGREAQADFGIYWFDIDGRRELLASDAELPCQQPVPLAARARPQERASQVDLAKETGTYYMQDVHVGPGLAGVPKGTVKKLRVVALEFRAAGVGSNSSGGPGGGALVSTPVSVGNGTWDVKRVLGEATVHEDGSAFFSAPARTPLYFQAVDAKGRVVQTMRSWSTLQPGENASCVGCHEEKDEAPASPAYARTMALAKAPQLLTPLGGQARGFSFAKDVQPILDRHCVRCHDDREPVLALAAGAGEPVLKAPKTADGEKAFSLLGETILDARAKRNWSDAYLVLTEAKRDGRNGKGAFRGNPNGRVVKWVSSQSAPTPQGPYTAGSTQSELMGLLDSGHGGVALSRDEYATIGCWIDLGVPYAGDYLEANAWSEQEMEKYIRYADKRKKFEEIDRESVRRELEER